MVQAGSDCYAGGSGGNSYAFVEATEAQVRVASTPCKADKGSCAKTTIVVPQVPVGQPKLEQQLTLDAPLLCVPEYLVRFIRSDLCPDT